MTCRNCGQLYKKYKLACLAADRLYETLKIREAALIKGKELVDQLMNVAVENERLKAENERLTAIIVGTEPPRHDDCNN